jgi:hypothetical protein
VVEGEVDLTEGGFDGAVVGGVWRRCRSGGQGRDRSEQAGAELDQEDAELQAARGQAIASRAADPLDEAVSAELAEVVAELGQAVVSLGEAVTVEEACEGVAGGPVSDEAAGMEEHVEQADHTIVLEAEAGHATLPDLDRLRKAGQLTLIDGAREQLGLGIEEALIGLGHPGDQRRQVLEAAADVEVIRIVDAGLGPQQRLGFLLLLDERGLVVGSQNRVALVAAVQHGLELAPVALRDLASKQVGGPVRASEYQAELDGTSEQRPQW